MLDIFLYYVKPAMYVLNIPYHYFEFDSTQPYFMAYCIESLPQPEKMCFYRHAVIMYKLFNNMLCDNEFIEMNFQLCDNARSRKITFIKNQRFNVGKNILLNRLYDLNNMIDKDWLNLSLDTYKTKCKTLFLKS